MSTPRQPGRVEPPQGPARAPVPGLDQLRADLADEHEALDERVAALDEAGWSTPTPAEGWDVRDQISHLWYFDRAARLALTDAAAFATHAEDLLGQTGKAGTGKAGGAHARSPDVVVGSNLSGSVLLRRWRDGRGALLDAIAQAAAADPARRVPWYGPAMGLASFVTARLMETWAHGTDVADALALPPVVTDRLRHVCHLGVGARRYSFAARGLKDPDEPVRVEAVSPAGARWTWGPPDAADRVSGPALDLALVLTQRRHIDDTALTVEGPTAAAWMAVAQAFAGPPGPGRRPASPPSGPAGAHPGHRTGGPA